MGLAAALLVLAVAGTVHGTGAAAGRAAAAPGTQAVNTEQIGWWDWLRPWLPKPRQPKPPAPPAPPADPAPEPAPEPAPLPDPPSDPGPSDPAPDPDEPEAPPGDELPSNLLAAAFGNRPSAVGVYENWLGRKLQLVHAFGGFERLPGARSAWENYDGSLNFQRDQWRTTDRQILWSIPLIAGSGEATLEAAAKGDYNDHYRKWAQGLAEYDKHDKIYVRTGWEFNGYWFPWTVQGGKEAAYRGAFQQFVKTFRAVDADRFVFEWCVNIGRQNADDVEAAYPGDAYVDIVGMDFYRNPGWPEKAADAWRWMVEQEYGLQWHVDFAKAHGKRVAYSEWGVRSDESAAYVTKAAQWFADHDVVYQGYWDSDEAFPGKLSQGQYPAAGEAYRKAFGPR